MRESMDKNRIKGVSVGRAGNLPRSAFRYRECQLVRGCRAPVAGAPLEDHKSVRFLYVPGDLREQAVGCEANGTTQRDVDRAELTLDFVGYSGGA
jgi:hypothetical protein